MTKREKDADITIIIRKDGDAWFAHGPDFTNLQESDAEWGHTPEEAAVWYIVATKPSRCETCKKFERQDKMFATYVCVGGLLENERVIVDPQRMACEKWEEQLPTEVDYDK